MQDYTSVKKLRPINIFYSYARKDERLQNELEKHLSILNREGRITHWHSRKIMPGTIWRGEIDRHLTEAQIILFLVSPDFLASDYCYNTEVQSALLRHNRGMAHAIPILLRPSDWEDSSFRNLQPLPVNRRPITRWRSRDQGFLEAVLGIKAVIAALEEQNAKEWMKPHDPTTAAAIIQAHMQNKNRYKETLDIYAKEWMKPHDPTTTAAIIQVEVQNKNRYKEALDIYEQATSLTPDDAFAYRMKGDILSELNRHEEALSAYEKAISLNPNDALVYINKGDVLTKLNRTQQALLAYGQGILLNPNEAISYTRRGDILYNLKRDKEAFTAYKLAISLNPVEAVAHRGIGDIFYRQKQYEEALIAYEKAIEIDPRDSIAHMREMDTLYRVGSYSYEEVVITYRKLFRSFYDQRKWKEALDVCDEFLNHHPDDPFLYKDRGELLHLMARYQEAALAYKRSGELLEEQGRYEEALSTYMLGWFSTIPPNALLLGARIGNLLCRLGDASRASDYYVQSGKSFYEQGQYKEALDVYDEAISQGCNNHHLYIGKGDALEKLGCHQDALIAHYNTAIQNIVASLFARRDKKENNLDLLKEYGHEALMVYKKAVQLDPHNYIANVYVRIEQNWSRLGIIDEDAFAHGKSGNDLYKQSQYQRALAAYDKAFNQVSENYLTIVCTGDIYAKSGRNQDALIAYERAIQLNSTNIIAYLKKGDLYFSLKAYDEALAVYGSALAFDKSANHALLNCILVYFELS